MVYATRVHVQEMEQNIFVIVASSNAPSAQYESAGIVLSRAGAEDLLKNLSEALKPEGIEDDKPELPSAQPAGEFGAEEELPHVGDAGWKERFGVQS